MTPVVASAANLPFGDRTFDAVVASDVLEHIPPELRITVIQETLRVANKLVIFGFPCGAAAHDADQALLETYTEKRLKIPVWLEEHMLALFPEQSLFENLPGWRITQFGNESISFHSWMMRQEMRRSFTYASIALLRFAPRVLEALLRRADGPPYYRQIFVLNRS